MSPPPPSPFIPALIVVDLQEDFCPPSGSLAVPSGRSILPAVHSLLSLPFALKLATKDWHPLNHISFAQNHRNASSFTDTTTISHPDDEALTYTTQLWPVHCVQGTPGAELVSELDTAPFDHVILKGTDARVEMYSAFTDPFWNLGGGWKAVTMSALPRILEERGVTHVYVVGLALDYCVKATAEHAVEFGYKTYVVREGTKAVGGEEAAVRTEEELRRKGVEVVGIDGKEVARVRALAEGA